MLTNNYNSFDSFVLRSPLFSIGFLRQLLSAENTIDNELKEICQRSEVQDAIFLASPNLHAKIEKWLEGEFADKKEIESLPQSIYKYLARMSSRSTPFGLFAGNSVGQVAGGLNLIIPSITDNRRVTRLDMNYLCAFAQDLTRRPDIRAVTTFYPNNSLYQFGDKLRYVEYYYQNTKRTHHIAAVDNSAYLQNVLNVAKKGATVRELAELLVNDDISIEEATDFIHELIDSQLLLPEFEPSVTGEGFLENILAFFENIKSSDSAYHGLKETEKQLKQIDNLPPGVETVNYYQIAESLNALGTNFELKFLFQTDMVKPVNNLSLSRELIEQVKEGVEVLNKLSIKPVETNLTKFRDTFYKKYEDAEVPLLLALDTESGIGYLQNQSAGAGDYSPLVDNLLLAQGSQQSTRFEWNNIHSFLFRKYIDSVKENRYIVELTEKEIDEWIGTSKSMDNLPVTISSMVQLVRFEGETKVVMTSAGGSSAANLLGRFCHTDEKIRKHVDEITQKEEAYYSDKIIAEIVHLPESRTGNILHRPVLRKYEIPFLAKSSVESDYQILPEDLFVSVKNNRIVLRSKRLNKEVVPRLTTAHNFSYNALPVYQFLCDMQTQDVKGGAGFHWGPLSGQYPFLPRISYKNLVFSLASWNIRKQDFEKITKIKDDRQLLEEVKKWRKSLNMPDWVALEEGDNELTIKLSNLLSVKTLISIVRNRTSFKLIEFLAEDNNMVVKNDEGMFTNEVILSFYREKSNE